jgi:hypothetical protein
MKIPTKEAEGLQYALVCIFGVDDYTPMGFGRVGPGCTREDWQWAVDWIYRLLSAGLLELWPAGMLDGKTDLTFDGFLDFARELAKQDPSLFKEVNEKPVPWIGPHLCLTDKAKRLIAKHGMSDPCQDYPLNVAFIEEMEGIFEAVGVPWSEGPLVPIRSASPSLQG